MNMRLTVFLFKAALAASMIFALPFMAESQLKGETVEGRATVKGGQVTTAKAHALEDAFRNKVEARVAGMLPRSVLEAESEALEIEIYERSREFISRYKIVNEYRDGKVYVIEAEVYLSEDALRNALLGKGFIGEKEAGLIFLMVPEARDGKAYTWWGSPPGEEGVPSTAEAVFAKILKEQGYTLIEPIPSQPRPEVLKLISDPDSPESLKHLEELYGANIFIQGRAKSVAVERKADTRTLICEARLNLAVIDIQEGDIIGRFSAQARAEANTAANAGALALENAARSTTGELLARLERHKPGAQISDEGKIVITIANLYSYKLYKTLAESIPLVPGVQGFELWGFSPGKVRFIVLYQGESLALANALARKNFEEFKLTIVEMEKNRIEMIVSPIRYLGPRQ